MPRAQLQRTRETSKAQKQKAFVESREGLSNCNLAELWEMRGFKTDWVRVSKKLAVQGIYHSSACCYTHFTQVLDPRLNTSRFTKTFATTFGGYNWDEVARQIPGRNDWWCFSRYQQSLNHLLMQRQWTDEDHDRLKRIISEICSSCWCVVAARMGHRHGASQLRKAVSSCRNRDSQHKKRSRNTHSRSG